MPEKNGIKYCDYILCPVKDKIIVKGTGFSFPIPNFFMHRDCYYESQKELASFHSKAQAESNIKYAKEFEKNAR